MKTLLLLAACSCAFVAMILAGQWGWLGIEPAPRLVHVYGYAAVGLGAASLLPWDRWFSRWHR